MHIGLVMIIVFFSLIIIGTPIAFSLGITGVISIYLVNPAFLSITARRFFEGINLFPLMAMPFFIFAGQIMNKIGITESIVEFANVFVGWARGGLAHANIVASILFAGLTGSAVSDTAALGSIMIPAMEKEGFDREFGAAVTAASSIIGPIIPPSVIMIIYGSINNVSIAGLFAAGIIPGILMGLLLMIFSAVISKRKNYPISERDRSPMAMLKATKNAIVAILMPIIILGGILSGVFTPTEAAAVAVFYAILVGFFYYKTLTFRDLWEMLVHTGVVSGTIFIILAAAAILSWTITQQMIPRDIAEFIIALTQNKVLILLIINAFLLVTGMFMDITAALIVLSPILVPIAMDFGVHPLHFGIIMTINLTIGLMTPPLGACLYVACGIGNITLEEISVAIAPFIVSNIITLLILTFSPQLVMFVPRLLGFA